MLRMLMDWIVPEEALTLRAGTAAPPDSLRTAEPANLTQLRCDDQSSRVNADVNAAAIVTHRA